MPSSPPPSPPPPLLAAGGLYAAVGLVRRPEVNGKVGALVATRAPGNGERALLRLAGTGEVVRAKPANLEAYVADGEGAPKCGVEHGKLPEVPFGQAFCFILDCARFVANEAAGQVRRRAGAHAARERDAAGSRRAPFNSRDSNHSA